MKVLIYNLQKIEESANIIIKLARILAKKEE